MPTAPTVDGRLLCASNCTYSITGNGTLPAGTPAPYYAGAGFLQPPATFVGGNQNIDACLVGTTGDGVVLAFRGTIFVKKPGLERMLDWFNDLDAELVTGQDLPGLVHAGFLGSLTNLWAAALAEVNNQLAQAAVKTVLVTGHSKGGGIAPLAAYRLAQTLSTRVITFAAPRAGNAAFAEAYNTSRISHTRYEYADDVVPHLPPAGPFAKVLRVLAARNPLFGKFTTLAYEPVGALSFINWSGQIVGDSSELELQRLFSIMTEIATFNEDVIVADHSITCGSGYMNAVCPTGVC